MRPLLALLCVVGCGVSFEDAVKLVRADEYKSLVVEIDHLPGAEPEAETIEMIRDTMTLLDKPRGVQIEVGEISGQPPFDEDKVRDLETAHRDVHFDREEGQAAIYLLFVDGELTGFAHSVTGGAALEGSVAAISRATRDAVCDGGDCNAVERRFVRHELGHLFGLVNVGTPMVDDHEAGDSGHDHSPSCVMFPELDTDAEEVDLPFDRACLNDLAALRENLP